METGRTEDIAHYLGWSDKGHSSLWRCALGRGAGFPGLVHGAVAFCRRDAIARQRPDSRQGIPAVVVPAGPGCASSGRALCSGRPGWSVALPAWPPRWADYGAGIAIGWLVSLVLTVAFLPVMPLHFASNTFNVFAVGVEGDVVTAFGPFNSVIPSPTVIALTAVARAATSVLLVELYRRWSSRSPAAAAV
jgi:hypothetical protein